LYRAAHWVIVAVMRMLGVALFALGVSFTSAACGSRTGLLVDEAVGETTARTTSSASSASRSASSASRSASSAGSASSASHSASSATRSTAPGCADAKSTSVFVVTDTQRLYQFDPPTASFHFVGTLNCPTQAPDAQPFSMAVSRSGTAYIVYQSFADSSESGELFAASTVDASCKATPFVPGQNGFSRTFEMAFASNAPAAGETLYVTSTDGGSYQAFATIDTNTYKLSFVATYGPSDAALTGTDSGELYELFLVFTGTQYQQRIQPIDKKTGQVSAGWTLDLPYSGSLAFVAWGGVFYTFMATFTGSGDPFTVVNRFDPMTGGLTQVATLDDSVVGAGVSTCAPGG
jgi:hypothetical protein